MLLIIVFCFTSRAELLERDVRLDKRGCGAMRAGGEDNLRVGILVHILETTNDAYDEEKSPLDVGEGAPFGLVGVESALGLPLVALSRGLATNTCAVTASIVAHPSRSLAGFSVEQVVG